MSICRRVPAMKGMHAPYGIGFIEHVKSQVHSLCVTGMRHHVSKDMPACAHAGVCWQCALLSTPTCTRLASVTRLESNAYGQVILTGIHIAVNIMVIVAVKFMTMENFAGRCHIQCSLWHRVHRARIRRSTSVHAPCGRGYTDMHRQCIYDTGKDTSV